MINSCSKIENINRILHVPVWILCHHCSKEVVDTPQLVLHIIDRQIRRDDDSKTTGCFQIVKCISLGFKHTQAVLILPITQGLVESLLVWRKPLQNTIHREQESANQLGLLIFISLERIVCPIVLPIKDTLAVAIEYITIKNHEKE